MGPAESVAMLVKVSHGDTPGSVVEFPLIMGVS